MKNLKSIIIVTTLIIVALVISGFLGNKNEGDIREPVKKESAKKEIVKVKNEVYTKTIETTGRMYAFEKVDVYAEVSGVLENNSVKFKEGKSFKKGETLLSINSEVYENTLKSQKSSFLNQLTLILPDLKFDFPKVHARWNVYLSSFKIDEAIKELPETNSERERYYIASNNIFKMYYDIKSMEATFNKYTVKAPFKGVVTESNINPGTLVRNGQLLGEFINTSLYEMEAVVKLNEIHLLKVGADVNLVSLGNDEIIKGKLVRINEKIDSETQSVEVFIQSRDRSIKDGMFFSAEFKSSMNATLAKLPKSAVKNTSVKIQKKNLVNEVKVEIFDRDDEYVFVKGLDDNSSVIIESTIN